MVVEAENKRTRRRLENTNKTIQLMKAMDKEIHTYREIAKTTKRNNSRNKRSNEDSKSLLDILEEFRSTRDAMQSNYEWKLYNGSMLNSSQWEPIVIPQIQNCSSPSIIKENQNEPRRCNMEIGLTTLTFGALMVIAYAIIKLINYKKRSQK